MNLYPLQSDHPLFRYLTTEERSRVEKLGEIRHIAPGEYVIRAGETDSTLYAIENGQLQIIAPRDGEPAVVATIGTGDVLGEVSFIDDSARIASVMAPQGAIIRAWNREKLTGALSADTGMLAKFLLGLSELLVERLRATARRV